jgi:hypothetical protein
MTHDEELIAAHARIDELQRELRCVKGYLGDVVAWRRTVEHRFTTQGTKLNVALARVSQAWELLEILGLAALKGASSLTKHQRGAAADGSGDPSSSH